jgi:uncharacterized protein (TIGR02599 family)
MKTLFVKNNKGFTLVELLVSLALFSIVILVVLSILSMGITGQRKVLALQGAQENARFILEFIAKELRMSVINGSTASTLDITRSDGNRIGYSFTNGNIERRTIPGGQGGAINSDSVTVSGSFYVAGVGKADSQQPKVTIILGVSGKGTKTEEQARIDMQTTLSQRILDVP